MKRRNLFKRAIAGVLTFCTLFSLLPTSVLAAEAEAAAAEQEAIRQTLLESVDAEEYPQGLFDFLTPRMETSEDVGEAEFAIIRRGSTDEAASVAFKIIDMTAEYGKDYVIKVPGLLFDRELEANPDSQPLYSEGVYTIGDDTEPVDSDSFGVYETDPVVDTELELPDDDADGNGGVYVIEPDTVLTDFDDLDYYELDPVAGGSDLQSARTALTGAASDNTTWREVDEAEIAVLTEAYGDLYDELEGIEYVLNFAPGEYIKTLKFVTLDDEISEDEEQVLFVLCHPQNGAVSDNPTGFMNIVDDEEPEELNFGFTTDVVTVEDGSFKAELTVERLTGLYRYGTVEVSSAEETAVEGVHYDGFAAELTFVPGQQYQKIEIPIKSHPTLEDVEFLVYVGDYDDYASVVIQSSAAVGETDSISNESGGAITYSLRATSNDVMLLGTNDDLWTRKETVRPSDSMSGYSNKGYMTADGWARLWMNLNDRSNTTATATLNVDLSMVGKLKTKSDESWSGTWYDDTWWLFGWHGSKGYYNNMWTKIYIGDTEKVSNQGKYDPAEHLITLNDTDRKAGSVKYKITTSGNTKHVQSGFSRDIELYYLPIEIQIGMWDDDAMIQKRIYTSPTNYTNDGAAFLAGKLKFQGEKANVTSKFFYNNDIVRFEETSRTEADNTYLWGIKFEAKAGATNEFFYYEGTEFSIKDLYTGKLKDVNGKTIGSTAKLSDTINGETFPCYRVYPVYRQKTAFTTIKSDETKSQFATGTFKNEETFKTGILDKIQINIAGKGDWAVSGFNLACANRNTYVISPDWMERNLYKEKISDAHNIYTTWSPLYRQNSDWARSLVNADAATPGSYLFSPTKTDNSLEALYQRPEITVAVNPRADSKDAQSQGYVAYADENGNGQIAKYTGTDSAGLLRGDEISIAPYRTGETYQLIGGFNDASETGYKFQWQDFTGDIDRDGKLSYEEIKALGNGYDLIDKGVYAGDIFNYVPKVMGSPVLYYNIIPKSENDTGLLNSLSGNVLLRSSSVIENSKLKPTYTYEPIANATVTAGGETAVTNAEGKWEIESASFAAGETYTATLAYGGRSYTGDVTVNRWATDFLVDEYNTFNVTNFNAFRVSNDSEYENVPDWNLHGLSNSAISNEDKRHLYTFEIEELLPTTATVGRVEVNRYSADGVLKKAYTAVYNEENGVYEVKDPALLENYTPGEGDPAKYIYSFNPATETIVAGDYLTVRVYDQYDVGYIEHDIGFSYKPKLSVINIVNSFQSPVNKVIDFIGDVDMVFDLGLTAKMDDLDTKLSDTVENKLNVATDDSARTISFGWNKDFKKAYDSSKTEDDKKDENKNPESSEEPKSAAETVKEEAKKLEEASDQPGADKDKKDAATDTAKQAVDQDSKENEKTSKVTADMAVNLSVALELVMGYDNTANRYYFQDFVVTGVVKGQAGAKYEYTTPIGIVVFVKGSLSGDITALLAIEPYYQNPAEPEYLYMDEAGTIDLTSIGNADVNRQLSIYGKLMVRPKVTLSVGASALSDKVASVSLNGSADFDMVFTTAGDGAGNVTLTADLLLEVLGGMVTKRWLIAQETYNMFSYNSGSLARLMSVNEDYRYDVITEEDTDEKLYLENRGGWDEWGDISLFTTGTESYNEVILQTGAYPYAYPQIFMLYEGDEYDYTGATSEQLLLFLDSDSEKVCLMYSIYQDSGDGRGYTWTQPSPVDADTAGDDTPRVEDLGDKLFITWSSQSRNDSDDPVAKLNSRDIKAVFFDKSTKDFSDVQYVTKTTDADTTADDYASASYYKVADNTELLMVTYIKTQYEQTSDELVVGDLLDAYSTIAYRFYDFETEEWVETYSGAAARALRSSMSDEEIELFEENWYGQGFVDLSRYVTVDDSNLLIPEGEQFAGLWSEEPDKADISIATLDNDPKVVEHETINCGKYAVSAYLVDLDKNLSTIDDRDIFLQFYDFEDEVFYPAMRLTNDAYNQTYLEFMDAPDGVTLYYISDGNIVQQNISDIVNYLIEAEVDGETVLLQNKCYGYYSGEAVIFESDENNPYTEFILNTDGYNVYLTWTESGISVAEGIDINSSEATLPENYYAERQMYMAMQTFIPSEYQHMGEDGNPLTYPATDNNGDTIDWNTTPDINGEVGKVKAGDPIVRTVYASKWTEPVQMTDEQGANFSDIDCVMIGGGYLRCVYLKGMSEIMEVGGELMPTENTDNRALISADFNFNVERYSISIDNADEVEAGLEGMPIHITVKNESLLTMNDILIPLNMFNGEEQTFVGDATIDEIIGGGSATVTIDWNVPEMLEDVSLVATVYHGGLEYESATADFSYDGLIEITDVSYELLDRNTVAFTVTVQNTGSENAVAERVYVNCGGVVSKSEEFDLVSGSTAMITLTAEIPEDAFEESRTETEITESAPVKVYTTGSIVNHAVVRSADVALEVLLDSITGLVDLEGNAYSGTIQMDVGDMMMLEAADGGDAINRAHLSVESENESVVSVVNGVLTGETMGSTKLYVELYPNTDTYLTDDSGSMRAVNNYLTLPSSLIRTMEVTALVGVTEDDITDHYTVTFDANGGTCDVATMDTGNDYTLASLPVPTRSGYTFKGWYTASTGGTKVTTSTVFEADTTVYAQWVLNYSGSGDGDYDDGSSEASVTVPISGDDNTIHVSASVSGGKATIQKVDLTKLDKVIGDHVENVGTITIDFSVLDKPITTVEIPSNVVKQIADAVNAPHNDAKSLEIILSNGISIEFDAVALGEKTTQADGQDITISIKPSEDLTLTAAQQEAIKNRPVYDISVTSGGKHISDMGGKITIHAPYELRSGEYPRGIMVWYVDENGKLERCETSYNPVRKLVNWHTDHLSLYMIDYDETLVISPFTDVGEDKYYYDSVLWAYEQGITGGTSSTTFSPDDPCTRAQMATFLWRTAGSPDPVGAPHPFTDVPADAYYAKAVQWAYENGITGGTSATTYSPDESCTRGQMATFLWRNAGSQAIAQTVNQFTDVPADAYYAKAVQWAYEQKITAGTSATTFSPDDPCTRAQMVTFLYRNFGE